MIYQKLTTGMGQCLLLIRKHADRDGFELWRRKERCWCYFNNVGAEYFKAVSYTHLTLPTILLV